MTAPIQPDITPFWDMPDNVCMMQIMSVQEGQMVTASWIIASSYGDFRDLMIQQFGMPFAEGVIDANAATDQVRTIMDDPGTQVVYGE